MAQMAQKDSTTAAADVSAPVSLLKNLQITDNTQELAGKTAGLWTILEMMRAGRPSANDPNRAVYDAAVSQYGGLKSDANLAIDALETLHLAMITSLHSNVRTVDQLGSSASAISKMCIDLQNGILDENTPRYAKYDAAFKANEVTELNNVAVGGTQKIAVGQTRTATPLPVFNVNMLDLGPVQLISRSGEQAVQSVGSPVITPTIRSMFGLSDQNSSGFLKAYALAVSYQANHAQDDPNMQKPAAKQICQQLVQYINQIPAAKDIMDASTHPNFNEAVKSLNAGNLYLALNYLSQETSFNAVYGALSNFFVISVNQRAVEVFHGGTNVKWEFEKNQSIFQRYIKDLAGPEALEPKIVYLAMGLYYQYLNMSGQLLQMQATPGGLAPVGQPQRVTGTGHALDAQGAVGIATSTYVPWNKPGDKWVPMTIVLHCSGGSREWSMGANIALQDGTKVPLMSQEKSGYLGIWGVELQFPGKEGSIGRVRLTRVGGAGVGTAEGGLAYMTWTVQEAKRQTSSGKWKMEALITPQFSDFLGQIRWGGEVEPLNITRQWEKSSGMFGPGIRFDYNIANQNSTFELFGNINYHAAAGLNFNGKAGWVSEFFGEPSTRIPATPFGEIKATFTFPKLLGKPAKKDK